MAEKPKNKVELIPSMVDGMEIPLACRRTSYGDILLRNDGFSRETVNLLNLFYIGVHSLFSADRLAFSAASLQTRRDLMGQRVVDLVAIPELGITRARPLVDITREAEIIASTDEGIMATFQIAHIGNPLRLMVDAGSVSEDIYGRYKLTPALTENNPQIVVARSSSSVVDYALARFANPPACLKQNEFERESVNKAIDVVMKRMVNKQLKR